MTVFDGRKVGWVENKMLNSSPAGALPVLPHFKGFGTERARLGTFRGFGTERAKLGTFRGLCAERARLDTFNQNFENFYQKIETGW